VLESGCFEVEEAVPEPVGGISDTVVQLLGTRREVGARSQ
jgi:hypothetical protein